jgi:hypothetical protein
MKKRQKIIFSFIFYPKLTSRNVILHVSAYLCDHVRTNMAIIFFYFLRT